MKNGVGWYNDQKVYYRGDEFEFICPDTHCEENTLQRFMLLDLDGISICYSQGYYKGYVKWRGIPTVNGHNGVTKESLILFLKDWYKPYPDRGWNPIFDEKTLKFIQE
jgi:hypothetical protein